MKNLEFILFSDFDVIDDFFKDLKGLMNIKFADRNKNIYKEFKAEIYRYIKNHKKTKPMLDFEVIENKADYGDYEFNYLRESILLKVNTNINKGYVPYEIFMEYSYNLKRYIAYEIKYKNEKEESLFLRRSDGFCVIRLYNSTHSILDMSGKDGKIKIDKMSEEINNLYKMYQKENKSELFIKHLFQIESCTNEELALQKLECDMNIKDLNSYNKLVFLKQIMNEIKADNNKKFFDIFKSKISQIIKKIINIHKT